MDRWDMNPRWDRGRYDRDYERDDPRARDIGWRGTELDRGFSGRYEYDRGYEDGYRDRDRELRRSYWDEHPWSRGRGR